jgi:enediyne biosynthesis protein E4
VLKFRCILLLGLTWLAVRASADSVVPLTVPAQGKPGFSRLSPAETAITFTNLLADDRAATNRNLLSGSGVAAGDVDGDGRTDLYFCALDNDNVLYRNLGGLRFEPVPAPEIACAGMDCSGAVFADVDGDRDLDLLVNSLGRGTHLFLNKGKGSFAAAPNAGLKTNSGATSMALSDIDGDGDLDLYVTNFRPTTIRDNPQAKFSIEFVRQKPVVVKVDGRAATAPDLTNRFFVAPSGEVMESGEADVLYENDGAGRFTAIPFTSGRFLDEGGRPLTQPPFDWGLAAQFYDFTGDGAPDLYVCNDYWTPDRIWINDGKGNFRAAPELAVRSTSRSSMGVDFADIDHDGDADCIVVDMLARTHADRQKQVGELQMFAFAPGHSAMRVQLSQNTLLLNRGDRTFAQIGEFAGVEGSDWSWCPIFIDVDLDGWEDLLVSNGHRRDFQDADAVTEIQRALAAQRISFSEPRKIMDLFPRQHVPKGAFRNNRDLTFSDAAAEWGLTQPDISHGFCLADLDNDGDLDLVMNNLGTAAVIYRNESNAPRIAVRLEGAGRNGGGAGARITMRQGSLVQTQEMIAGGRYLSGDAMERVFAAPGHGPVSIEIKWRTGQIKTINGLSPNHRYVFSE